MATTLTQTEVLDLAQRFPGVVTKHARQGYSGWLVDRNSLIQVATAVRDEFGFDLLSSVTGVDYFPDKMEVVYQVYKTTGGPGMMFKVQVPRVDPIEIASVTPVWPGAEFQEREIYDLYGIKFTGHPDLRRILMWEGFEGHPLRKDWKEPFYEDDVKPFKSRWPNGQHVRAEDRVAWHDNVQYPAGWDPETVTPEAETLL